eukprot:TRINITY_DN28610_c0_g1_i1.p1 TRINITY_DN28610_c0_g1~~TRINITY_DN28610_c0_g1_i1.p1  ORF type:complete len:126 (-),score=3.82 TRINITY_DN28610_c0_g1_i1:90-467(-)
MQLYIQKKASEYIYMVFAYLIIICEYLIPFYERSKQYTKMLLKNSGKIERALNSAIQKNLLMPNSTLLIIGLFFSDTPMRTQHWCCQTTPSFSQIIISRLHQYLQQLSLNYTCLLYTSPSPRDQA